METTIARVLVVDDSVVARRALAAMLEQEGFEVATAASAREADAELARRAAGGVDLILMDLHMPEGTGIDACARIKRRPGWEDVPVIVVTSSDDDRDLTLAFNAGAADYITKPPRHLELLARVRAALRLKDEMTRRKARERELQGLNVRLTEQAAELSAAREALLSLNGELERRVLSQVDEIVRRAEEIDALNAQLRVQVRERSRELAEALRRLDGREPDQKASGPGTLLGGRVRLVRRLATGGMGVVYVADDLVTRSTVAVKLLDLRLGLSARDLQRFIDEASAAAAIAHPAVVKTTHVDVSAGGHLFLVMELVDGATLGELLTCGPLAPEWCVSLGRVVADALAAAHQASVIHRDVKPSNLILCREAPGVRVLDFGISKIRTLPDRTTLTRTGDLLGTPAYMAPEQIENASAVTPASDVYSLGAVLFEAIAGAPLFQARDLRAWLLAALQPAPRLAQRAPHVHPDLAALVDACLSRDPAARPPAAELAASLAALGTRMSAPSPTRLLDLARDRPVGRALAESAS